MLLALPGRKGTGGDRHGELSPAGEGRNLQKRKTLVYPS